MAGAQKCHNFQADILWSFSHHMWLRIPDQKFEQTAPLKLLRYRPHNEFCLFNFFWLPSVDWKLRFVPPSLFNLDPRRHWRCNRCLLWFCDPPVYCFPNPLAVSVGSRCCHLVPSFLPPLQSNRCLCPCHEVTFHPSSSFIMLSTQIFNVAEFDSVVSKFTERGHEVSWLLFNLFLRLCYCASVVLGIHFAIGFHFFYPPS